METSKTKTKTKNQDQNTQSQNIQKNQNKNASTTSDTLLVLHNTSNIIGIIQNINPDGSINQTSPDQEYSDPILKIDPKEDIFTQFYSDFHQQLKNPEEFTFFKVTEYDAKETAKTSKTTSIRQR